MIIKIKKNYLIGAIIVLAVAIISGGVYFKAINLQKQNGEAVQEVAEKAIKYVNENLLAPGYTASLVSAVEESGLVKIKIQLEQEEFDSYVTLDGKYIFPSGFNMDEDSVFADSGDTGAATPEIQPKSCDDIKKSENSFLEVFVSTQCPYGAQIQRVLGEIVRSIPQAQDYIKVEYIGSIENGKMMGMFGSEAPEDLRQICVREEQNAKYWDYISCYIKEAKSEECLKEAKIDEKKLESCVKDASKGLEYAQKDFALQEKYRAYGSPTLILNGESVNEFDFGGRIAEAVKILLCCGFNAQPEFCDTQLDTRQAAIGTSKEYADANVGAAAGGCSVP